MSRHYQTLVTAQQHLERGKPDQARAALQRALQKDASDPDLNNAMAIALVHLGQREQATFYAQRAAKARPEDPGILATLGGLLSMADKPDEAIPVLERACALDPGAHGPRVSLVNAYTLKRRHLDAARHCRAALALRPGNIDLTTLLVKALLHAGRADEAAAAAREARAHAPGHLDFARALAFALNYVDQREAGEAFAAHVELGKLLDPSPRSRPAKRAIEGTPLRVGLVSADLRDHPVAYFLEPLLEHRDRTSLQIVCFSNNDDEDAYSARLLALGDGWHAVKALDDAALAALVASEKIDVLVDLAGLTGGNRLGVFPLRAAPVQATYLGYPNTTGLSCVDVRLADSITDPPGAERLCVERLARLDPCFLCFQPSREAPDPAPAPSAAAGHVTFASFNTLLKLNDATGEAWARILSRVAGSRLVLKCTQVADPLVREATLERFASRGVDPSRVEFLQITGTAREHLALYARADIALDPFPYNGTTTTCEALWMGVPVVTLRGQVHASRVGASLLTAVGAPELIATSTDDYVERAAALASDGARLAKYRASLRRAVESSSLRDGAGFARRFERVLRQAYEAAPAPCAPS